MAGALVALVTRTVAPDGWAQAALQRATGYVVAVADGDTFYRRRRHETEYCARGVEAITQRSNAKARLVVPIEPSLLISPETRIPPWQIFGLFKGYFKRDTHLLPCELFCNLYRRTRAKIACFRALANAKPLTGVFFEA